MNLPALDEPEFVSPDIISPCCAGVNALMQTLVPTKQPGRDPLSEASQFTSKPAEVVHFCVNTNRPRSELNEIFVLLNFTSSKKKLSPKEAWLFVHILKCDYIMDG